MMRVGFDRGGMRPIGRARPMTGKTELLRRFDEIRVIRRPVNVVTREAGHAVFVHRALDKVITLHSILVSGAIGEMSKGGLAELVLLQLPEVFEIRSLMESDGPVVILSLDRILQGLSLGVTLNARVVGADDT